MPDEKKVFMNHDLFKGFNGEVAQKFVDAGHIQTNSADDILCVEGADNDDIGLILEGEISLEMAFDDSGISYDIGQGEFFGLVKFVQVDDSKALFTATAKSDTKILIWKASQWRQLCDSDPQTGYTLAMRVGHILVQRMLKWHMNIINNTAWGIE